uniref:AI-2E family transporter n=1 Tax=Candidatus Limisoma sp. TaxID=3076476 RepID=UPI003FED6866
MFDTSRPFTFDRVVRILITIATLIGAYWLLKAISGALLPFCVACLLAYIFEPFVAFNKRLLRCRGNVLPIFLFLVELFGVIALLGWFLIPRIIDEIVTVGNLFNDYATSSSSRYIPQAVHDFVMKYVDMKTLASVLTQEQWSDIVQKSLSGTWTMVSGSISMLLTVCSWFIVLLYFIFILLDYDRFMNSMRSLIPQKYKPTVLKIAGDIKNSMNRYFRGQTLVALCVGVLFSIGFLIIDLPLAIIMGMFIGLLNMVPYLQLISLLPTTLLCVVYAAETNSSFWVIFALAMVVYGVVQLIQDLSLVPKIMAKTLGLNPAIILLSLSIWGSLLGFLGLIIALPLTTLLLSYYNTYVLHEGKPEESAENQNIGN